MRSVLAATALMAGLAGPSGLHAQNALPDEVMRRPGRSLSIDASGGGAALGYWTRLSDATDLGIEGGFDVRTHTQDDDQTSRSFSVTLSPALKRHLKGSGELAPYALFGLTGSWSRATGSSGNSAKNVVAGVKTGFGLEWFPISSLSVGAHLGVSAGYQRSRDEFGTDMVRTSNGLFIRTEHSGIRLHLYF